MPYLRRLARVFNVRHGEERLVLLLLLHSFFIGISGTLTDTAANALFLVRYEAQLLPMAYIIAALVTIVVGLIYAWLEPRLSFGRLLGANLLTIVAGLAFFGLSFTITDAPWPAMMALVGYNVLWVLASLEFWGLAGRVFNVRQAKRLFGLIGAGEVLAAIVSGAAVTPLLQFVETPSLFYIAAGASVFSFVMMLYIVRRFLPGGDTQDAAEPAAHAAATSTVAMLKERYLLLIFMLASVAITTFYFVDNAFLLQVQQQYPDSAALASFLGIFNSISGFLQLFTLAVLSGWLLSRFGVMVGLLVLPLSLAAGASLVIAADRLGAVAGTVFLLFFAVRLADRAFRYTLNRASVLVLYQPLSTSQRLRVQAVTESIIEPLAGVLAGLVLLYLNTALGFSAVDLLLAMLLVVVVWMAVVVLLSRQYVQVLVRALNRRWLQGVELRLNDSASLKVLEQALNSSYPGEVVYALQMLEAGEHPALDQYLYTLIAHPLPEVRPEVLKMIARREMKAAQPELIARLVDEPLPAIKGQVLQVLAALGAESVVLPYLDHPLPDVRLGAIVGLLKWGDGRSFEAARQCFDGLEKSESSEQRIFAGHVIGAAGLNEHYRSLMRLLLDQDVLVRQAALNAVPQVQHAALWPLVAENLLSRHVGVAAVHAMSSGGDQTLVHLERIFSRPGQPRHVLIRVLRVLGRIRSEAAVRWLNERIDYPDKFLRYFVLEALRQCGYRVAGPAIQAVERQIQEEVAWAAHLLAAMMDIGEENAATRLLYNSLQGDLLRTQSRIFLLMTFLYDPATILTMRENLSHRSAYRQAYALELLESAVAPELRVQVLPLLESQNPARQLRRLSERYPQTAVGAEERLRMILSQEQGAGFSPWVRACAAYCAVNMGRPGLTDELVTLLADPDAITHETAVWALHQLAPGLYQLYVEKLERGEAGSGTITRATITRIEQEIRGERGMLLTIEKVIILKTVSIFSEVPEDLLAEIATLLETREAAAGQAIIVKGEMGDCMYIIARGRVRVHDGERVIAMLGEREVVGELALLDAEPRNASVTAEEDTVLLRLGQDPFYELISTNTEVVRGIMRVLTRRLRASTG